MIFKLDKKRAPISSIDQSVTTQDITR